MAQYVKQLGETVSQVQQVQEFLDKITQGLIGKKAWQAERDVGSFISFDFGEASHFVRTRKVTGEEVQFDIGEWYLWLYLCAWRIDTENMTLAASEDSMERIDAALAQIQGKAIQSISITNFALDAVFEFEGGIFVRSFSIYTDESKDRIHWRLRTSENMVFLAGPGKTWSYVPWDK